MTDSVLTGMVVGTVGRVLAQTGSPLPQQAQVTFTADVSDFPAGGELLVPDPVTCQLDEQGRILNPAGDGTLGVELAASENVQGGFTYEVTISGSSFTTRRFHLVVHANQQVDLATAVRVPTQPGTVISTLQAYIDTIQGWLSDPEFLRGAQGLKGDTGDPGVRWDEQGRPYIIRPEGQ